MQQVVCTKLQKDRLEGVLFSIVIGENGDRRKRKAIRILWANLERILDVSEGYWIFPT